MFRTSPTTPPKGPAPPRFPAYLLPSLKIPFFRRRHSSNTPPTTAETTITFSSAASNDVPSLSSSPTSTTSSDFPSPSPAIIETNIYQLPTDIHGAKPSSHKLSQPASSTRSHDRDRLGHTLPDILRCNTCGTDVAYGLQVVSKGFTGRHGRALLVSPPQSTSTPSCPGTAPDVLPGHHAMARDGADLVNVTVGRPESRPLVTGAHVVADISCGVCGVKIGWKYLDAREPSQKYKVGRFILETERVVMLRSWEDVLAGEDPAPYEHFYSSSAPAGMMGAGRKSSVSSGRRKVSCSSEGAGVAGVFEIAEEGEEESDNGSQQEVEFDSDDEDECEDIFAGIWDANAVARRRSIASGSATKSSRASNGDR